MPIATRSKRARQGVKEAGKSLARPMLKYNANSSCQERSNRHFYPHLREQVQAICKLKPDEISIGDLGCSHGKNSMICVKAALDGCGYQPRLNVYLNDLPSNDFGEVTKCLNDPDTSFLCHPKCVEEETTTFMVGKSFYKQVLPTNQIDLAFCFSCLHWLDFPVVPSLSLVPGSTVATPEENDLVALGAHRQLVTFFQKRGLELKSGGRLVCSIVKREEYGNHLSLEWIAFLEMRSMDISRFQNVTIPVYSRATEAVEAALGEVGQIFSVLHFSNFSFDDPPFQHTALKHATFNSLLSGICDSKVFPSRQECEAFAEDFFIYLESTRSEYKVEIHSLVLKRV